MNEKQGMIDMPEFISPLTPAFVWSNASTSFAFRDEFMVGNNSFHHSFVFGEDNLGILGLTVNCEIYQIVTK